MSGEKIVRALDAIPDEQLQSAMSVYDRKKKLKYIWVRGAVFVTVLVILIAAVVLNNAAPCFSVKVYASETDCAEFSQKGDTIFIPASDHSDDFSYRDDPSYRPELDSYITDEGGKLWDSPVFWLNIWLNDKTKDYDQIMVLVDGKQLKQNFEDGLVGYLSKGEEKGRFVCLPLQEIARLDIMLYDDNGEILQHYGMAVEPVEGGWLVTLDEANVPSWGSRLISMWS